MFFRDLGNVVDDGEEDGAGDEELLDVVLLERVDDGEEALEGDGHGGVDGAHPGHVERAVAEGDDVHRNVVAVPGGKEEDDRSFRRSLNISFRSQANSLNPNY